jgi:pyrimidine operon attenuation protein / uracil phosphoribosyltransferase
MDVSPREVMTSQEISRAVARMAHQLGELIRPGHPLVLLGIPTRGVPLARRLADHLVGITGQAPAVGELDVTMYRDDLRRQPTRSVGRSTVPIGIDDADVVLVDDVLSTGRTVLAALEALRDFGRPQTVRLVVLVDRGNREVPVRPDVVGLDMRTARDERVQVHLEDVDSCDEVIIERVIHEQTN